MGKKKILFTSRRWQADHRLPRRRDGLGERRGKARRSARAMHVTAPSARPHAADKHHWHPSVSLTAEAAAVAEVTAALSVAATGGATTLCSAAATAVMGPAYQ